MEPLGLCCRRDLTLGGIAGSAGLCCRTSLRRGLGSGGTGLDGGTRLSLGLEPVLTCLLYTSDAADE